jgi:F-type H+-transporting ATPase subunit alpha
MKKVAGTLKLQYSQYRELQSFAQFGSDLDADTKARLDQGARIVEVLKQNRNTPMPVEHQVVILYAATKNLLADIEVGDITRFETEFIEYIGNIHNDIFVSIAETKDLTSETEEKILAAVADFKKKFKVS